MQGYPKSPRCSDTGCSDTGISPELFHVPCCRWCANTSRSRCCLSARTWGWWSSTCATWCCCAPSGPCASTATTSSGCASPTGAPLPSPHTGHLLGLDTLGTEELFSSLGRFHLMTWMTTRSISLSWIMLLAWHWNRWADSPKHSLTFLLVGNLVVHVLWLLVNNLCHIHFNTVFKVPEVLSKYFSRLFPLSPNHLWLSKVIQTYILNASHIDRDHKRITKNDSLSLSKPQSDLL